MEQMMAPAHTLFDLHRHEHVISDSVSRAQSQASILSMIVFSLRYGILAKYKAHSSGGSYVAYDMWARCECSLVYQAGHRQGGSCVKAHFRPSSRWKHQSVTSYDMLNHVR